MSDAAAEQPFAERSGGVVIRLKVVPNASSTEIVGVHGDRIKVRVSEPPDRGKANAAICALLVSVTGASAAEVISGHGSQHKTVILRGVCVGPVRRLLGE